MAEFLGTQITGIKTFRFAQSFTRPADTVTYATGDAITNSTAILSQDLSSFGAVAGGQYLITNARVISNANPSLKLAANVFVFNNTFTVTADNTALDIAYSTASTGGIAIMCGNDTGTTENNFSLGTNSRCVSNPGGWMGRLGSASTSIFVTLQARNAYIPASGEIFTVVMEGYLL